MSFPVHIPFVEHLGVKLVRYTAEFAELGFEPAPEHLNSLGVVHGGVLMTLLDVCMASAGRYHNEQEHLAGGLSPQEAVHDAGNVTIEMKTTFMLPARGVLLARGICVHRTRSMMFAEGEIRDAAGTVVARSSGTFRRVRKSANS
jgi:uncharacterized protein (TIGR00369 family)